ncbi:MULTISPECIES: prephenate dehydrogenase [Paenibacillus]|uniref:prephenate dehydrogenase n=1 Tax=Paenibacillus TaxID=44249 RepID=UPI00203D216E|nr:prephenate dehydrogenase [Paenibacillus camelliae]MCM3633055.1 prephenate dehydrogenase [Paenibacillus camelliae]
MKKVAIFGVGLIGGSIALSLKGQQDLLLCGYSNREASAKKYVERGVVDYATTSVEEAASDADFIFLCVPVGMMDDYIQKLSTIPLKEGCIITDVGSTKLSVMNSAKALAAQNVIFIGGHPMAGSERSGVEAASSRLLENAFYVLTAEQDTPPHAIEELEQLLSYTRAHIVKVDAAAHDTIVGAISHLPHIIAVGLVNQVRSYNDSNGLYELLAAGGFRDITRIASGDPPLWRDILLDNKEVLLQLLDDWQQQMSHFRTMLEQSDGPAIVDAFASAGQFRSRMPERRKGIIHSVFDCFVDIPDHPGIVGSIASELGKENINISNIQIIESREQIPGVLRLSFRTQEQLDDAIKLLQSKGYHVEL